MRSVRCHKELLPIAFISDPVSGEVRPILVIEYALQAMIQAGVKRCLLVVSDRKPELLRYLGNGSEVGMNIAYLNQAEPLGLACAIDEAHAWTLDRNVSLALPDSIFTPSDAILRINTALVSRDCDLVLGVFPTDRPHHLGPVRFDEDGRVLEVLEKPPTTDLRNTWGIAAWSPRFSRLLNDCARGLEQLSIGHIFNQAVQKGLRVQAVHFKEGSYADLGTPESIVSMLLRKPGELHGC